MGVDSGLPDFRGREGSGGPIRPTSGSGSTSSRWPTRAGLPRIRRWPGASTATGWGSTGGPDPHQGFAILRRWAEPDAHAADSSSPPTSTGISSAPVFLPSNRRSPRQLSMAMQCTRECGIGLFSGESVDVEIDPATMRAIPALPCCPQCGGLARPNILMFGDWGWDSTRTDDQLSLMNTWIESLDGASVVVIECGAGQAIPTVRSTCERFARKFGGLLIRINPREPEVPAGHVSIALGALAALEALDLRLVEPRA